MVEFDKTKSLQELENEDWGEPNFDSYLVQECHRLRRIPLKDFRTQDLRVMIGQNIGVDCLMPLAIEKLEQNPLPEGDFYAGDLLVSVMRVDSVFWKRFPSLKQKVTRIASRAFEIPTITKAECESIREVYNLFCRVSMSES